MSVALTPVDDIEGAAPRPSEWRETIDALEALPSKAAKFTIDKVDDELTRTKRAIRVAANRIGKTAVFGLDEPDGKGSTLVQVKLVEKRPGRPEGSVNAAKTDTADTPAEA